MKHLSTKAIISIISAIALIVIFGKFQVIPIFAHQPAKSVVYIYSPSTCHKFEKVEGNNIHLLITSSMCAQVISKIPVMIENSVEEVSIYVNGRFWKKQTIERFDLDDITAIFEKSKEKELEIQENIHKELAKKEAGEAFAYFKDRPLAEYKKLLAGIFGDSMYIAEPTDAQATEYKDIRLSDNERLYLFISSSMPNYVIRRYLSDISELRDDNITVVMRGFLGGVQYLRPTLRYLVEILKVDSECDIRSLNCEFVRVSFQIDPLLFREYNINKVPALVYVNSQNEKPVIIYGDAKFSYLIERIYEETRNPSLQKISNKLTGGFYSE